MKRLSLLAILLLVSSTTACAAAAPPKAPSVAPSVASTPVAASQAAAPAGVPAAVSPTPTPPPPAPHGTAKAKNEARSPVVIFVGDMKMLTEEDSIPKTIDRIVDIAEQNGGHIAARKDLSVQIKVPSAKFRETMSKIDEIGGVTSRSVQADDVSEEFHDLEVRLANLRTTRSRLQDFMAKATNVNEMLVVERELERIAQEIDRIEGRLEFLRTRAAMSTIAVAFTPKPKPAAPIVATPVAETPPPIRRVELPIAWMNDVGLDKVLSLKK